MSDHVYKLLEITGSSNTGVEDAVRSALGRASKSLRNLKWFEVSDIRGTIEKDKIAHWQVTMKVGFTLED